MQTSNNVIKFPKQNIKIPEQESIDHNMEMMRHYHIQETIGNLAPIIFNNLEIAGFPITEETDDNLKDGAFIIEAIRSIMCRYYGIYHPFQQISENVFFPDGEDIGSLRIADSLNIQLKNTEKN